MRPRIELIRLAVATVTTVVALTAFIVALVVLTYPVTQALRLGP